MADFNWQTVDECEQEKKENELEVEADEQEKARRHALDDFLVLQAEEYLSSGDVSEEEKVRWANVFEPFRVGVNYPVGKKVNHKGKVYEVIQTHTSQMDWLPPSTPSLFNVFLQPETEDGTEVIHEWKQPTDGHDAYVEGDKVSYEDSIYKSLIDGNTWKPTDYPKGWEELEELNE